MVEGHQGSLICGSCLTIAYTQLGLNESPDLDAVPNCTMCLEERSQPGWQSPIDENTVVCLRCIKQSATVFEKDPDNSWRRPGAG